MRIKFRCNGAISNPEKKQTAFADAATPAIMSEDMLDKMMLGALERLHRLRDR